VQLRFFLRIA